MNDKDRTFNFLDNVYVLSFFVQLVVMIAAVVVALIRTDGWQPWQMWTWAALAVVLLSCPLLRWYIKRWFRQHWLSE
jgi:hypothetical protein